jgi:hypothetical protein
MLGHFLSIQFSLRPPSRTLPSLRQIAAHALSRTDLGAVPVPISSRLPPRFPRLTEALQLMERDGGMLCRNQTACCTPSPAALLDQVESKYNRS